MQLQAETMAAVGDELDLGVPVFAVAKGEDEASAPGHDVPGAGPRQLLPRNARHPLDGTRSLRRSAGARVFRHTFGTKL
jgi:hypothetical protein